MATSADKFSTGYEGRKKARKKPPAPSVAEQREHQGKTPQPLPSSTRRVREHEGRVKQPGVPRGPRNSISATGKKKLAKQEAKRATKRGLKILRETDFGPDPHREYTQAKTRGVAPSAELKAKYPRAYKKALDAFGEHHAKTEGLKEDLVAEFVISTAATAGIGAGAKLAGTAAEKALLAKAGSKLSSSATSAAESVAEKGAKAVAKKVSRARSAPARAARRAKETPERVRTAPRRAKRAVTTKKGRRAAAQGAARKAAKHPVGTAYGAALTVPSGAVPGDVGDRARAFAEGSAKALLHHPGETTKTTLRGLSGVITGPVALGAAAVDSAKEGTADPLVNTAKEEVEGVKQIVQTAFSGDVKKAEEAARKEGSLSLLTPLPAVTKTKAYKVAREDVRGVAAAGRRRLAASEKLPGKEWRNRKVRHAPEGTGEHVSGLAARHDQRKRVSVIKARTDNPHRVAGDEHMGKVLHALAKAPKGAHIAMQTLAEYGIRDKRGADHLRMNGPGDKELLAALDYAEMHPHVFESKGMKEALEHYAKSVEGTAATKSGKGERARVLPQGDALGITRPERMVPHHRREELGADSWAEVRDRLKEVRKAQLAALRRDPKNAAVKADVELTVKLLKEAKKEASRKVNSNRKPRTWRMVNGKPQKVRLKDLPYDDARLKEYVDAVEAARKAAGLEKAIWTHHASSSGDKGAGFQNAFPTPAGRKEYAREGNLAKADELDRSLEGLVRGSILLPRSRAAGKEFMRNIVDEFSLPFTINGERVTVGHGSKDWAAITRRRSGDNPEGGQYDPRSVARLAYREFNNAIDDPFLTDSQRDARLLQILDAAESGKTPGNEPFVLVPREVVKEARAQISPETNILTKGMGEFAKISNRLILGTNLAWAVAQTVAEGVPLLISHPSLANPAKLATLYRDSKRYGDRHPELRATAGVSPLNAAALRQPHEELETYTPEVWSKGAEAMTRGKTARGALSLAKLRALGLIDVRRQNAYRKAMYAAEADRKFRSWHSGLTGLFDGSAAISKRFRGKSREELWDWLNTTKEGRKWKEKLEDHVDAVQGNWTAFTRYERALAPFAIFYPFIRYSLRWATWAFPKEHPVRATVITMLGQANANQLEALVGQSAFEEGLAKTPDPLPLSNPLGYSYPLYKNEDDETSVLPGGSRISPGQSSITQAVQSGNPAAVLSSLQPILGAGITATTGVEPFTGEQSSLPRGEAALNALWGLPSITRATDSKFGEQSVASKAFEQYDKNKDVRSFIFPFMPQSGEKFAAADSLGRAFDKKYGKNAVPSLPPAFYEAALNHDWKLAKKLRKEVVAAEHASDLIKAAEQPFYGKDGKEFDDVAGEILGYITGYRQVPYEKPKPEPFGIPSTDPAKLREQFGLPSTSASDLRKQFGIR
ncbi:MAG TPA: hypothetical protein VFJ76_07765 [Solirubrobacterales bacterium]|nr:hypothetical protein [Solirubrobacterales bacterium]